MASQEHCLYNDALCSGTNYTLNNVLFNITYHTDSVTYYGGNTTNSTLRKVVINVTWAEPQ